MSSFLRKYLPFTKAQVQEFLNYRAHAIVWVLMEFFVLALQYFIWKAVFDNSTSLVIRGFSFEAMVTYILISRVVSSLTFAMPGDYIANDVRSGSIAMQLIKPINYKTQLFFRSMGETVNSFVFFVIPLVILTVIGSLYFNLQASLSLFTILMLVFSILLAFVIRFLIGYCFGLIIFMTINSFGIWQLRQVVEMIFSGALIPIVFFPSVLQTITRFLPFMYYLYTPVEIFMGFYETNMGILTAVLLQLFWAIVMFIFARFMWNRVVHKLVVMGG